MSADSLYPANRSQVHRPCGVCNRTAGRYDAYTATGAFTSNNTLFELWLEHALHAKYGPRPSWPPQYSKWAACD